MNITYNIHTFITHKHKQLPPHKQTHEFLVPPPRTRKGGWLTWTSLSTLYWSVKRGAVCSLSLEQYTILCWWRSACNWCHIYKKKKTLLILFLWIFSFFYFPFSWLTFRSGLKQQQKSAMFNYFFLAIGTSLLLCETLFHYFLAWRKDRWVCRGTGSWFNITVYFRKSTSPLGAGNNSQHP